MVLFPTNKLIKPMPSLYKYHILLFPLYSTKWNFRKKRHFPQNNPGFTTRDNNLFVVDLPL